MKQTDEELKEIEETVEAAHTPYSIDENTGDLLGNDGETVADFFYHQEDIDLVVNAPTYIKALLAHIETEAAEKAALTEKLTDYRTRLKAGEESYMELQRKYYSLEQGLCRANLLLEKMEVSP